MYRLLLTVFIAMLAISFSLYRIPKKSSYITKSFNSFTSKKQLSSSVHSNTKLASSTFFNEVKANIAQHNAFEVVQKDYIDEYGIYAVLYHHKKTGAQIMSVINQDENKVFGITFRTPPSDSTGVPHVLEHSVLCGSRKYPVKEPFVDLLKGSLQNFLNAFTYPDRTCYPIATTNTKDFYNLVNVYLDAVLHPRAITDKQVLQQEGWHYELEDPAQPLTYKGVVYNEMKGVYSSPDSLLGRATQQALFPDNTYGVDSGGDPLSIPDLTFDQFTDFHRSYYHPSNSRIYFYGNDDPYQRLVLIDEYLSDFDKIPLTSQVQYQAKNKQPSKINVGFPVSPGTTDAKHMLTVNWLVNDKPLNNKDALALSVLNSLLLGTSSSVLRKALTESKLGDSVTGGGLSDELLQYTFGVGLKGVKSDDVSKVEELINATLLDISMKGFDSDDVKAAMNTLEFNLREFNTGSFPRGLSLMLGMLSHWIYDKPAFDGIKFEESLQELKKDIADNKPIFQDLINTYFISNHHRVVVEMVPDDKLEKSIVDKEEEKLRLIKESMSDIEIEDVIKSTKLLKEAQLAEDSIDAKATLPRLGLDDIDKKCIELPIKIVQENVDGVTILSHDVQSNGILYAQVAFDFNSVEKEDIALLPLFTRMLTEAGTASLDEASLTRRIGIETGGISASLITDMKSAEGYVVDTNEPVLYLQIGGKAVADKIPVMLDIFHDILVNGRIDNQKRVIEMLKESKVRKETSVITSGHTYASTRLASKFSFLGYLSEHMSGITSVREAAKLLALAENDWVTFQSKLERIRRSIVKRGGVVVNLTADTKTLDSALPSVHMFLNKIPTAASVRVGGAPSKTLYEQWKEDQKTASVVKYEGFAVPSQVNYVVKGGPIFSAGDRVPGSYSVVARYLSTGYLWDNVRVLGGAYGGFARFSEATGRFVFMSYRDPNLITTLDVYDKAASNLLSSEIHDEDILQGVIGTIGDLDAPMNADQKGYASFMQYLTKETKEYRQSRRDEILSSSKKDFNEFGNRLADIASTGSVVIVGSGSALEEGNKQLPDDKKLVIDKAY